MQEGNAMRNDPVVVPSEASNYFPRPLTQSKFSTLSDYEVMTSKEVKSARYAHTSSGRKPKHKAERKAIQSGRDRFDELTARVKLPPLMPTIVEGGGGGGGEKGKVRRDEGRGLWITHPSIHPQIASRKYKNGGILQFYQMGRETEWPLAKTKIPSATAPAPAPPPQHVGPLKFPAVGAPPMTPYHSPLPNIGQTKLPDAEESNVSDDTKEDSPPPLNISLVEGCLKNTEDHHETRPTSVPETKEIERLETAKSAKLDNKEEEDSHMSDELKASSETDYMKIVKQMGDSDISVRLSATVTARKQLTYTQIPKFLDAGIITPAIESLQMDNATLQYETLWVLTNIASGNSLNTTVVVESNVIPHMVRLLKSTDDRVGEQAVWALGIISGDSHTNSQLIIKEGVLPHLLDIVKAEPTLVMLKNCSWLLSNLLRHKPIDYSSNDLKFMMELAKILIENPDDQVQKDTLNALSYTADGSEIYVQAVIDHGFCSKVVELIANGTPSVRQPALRTCGNIATGTDQQTESILRAGVLEPMKDLLENGDIATRQEVCWILSNITAGTQSQKMSVIENGFLIHLVKSIREGPFKVSLEAIWAISNIPVGGNVVLLRPVIDAGGVEALLFVLQNSGPQAPLLIALEGLSNMLNITKGHPEHKMVKRIIKDNGFSHLESLKHSPELEERAEDISKYFTDDRDSDEDSNPVGVGKEAGYE